MFEGLFQPMHLLVLLFICLLVFGPKKVADLGKGLGEGIRGFKDAIREHRPALNQPPAESAAKTQESVGIMR